MDIRVRSPASSRVAWTAPVASTAGTATPAFDCDDVVPHVPTSVQGGMVQILQITGDGSRLLTGLFQTGQIVMIDITNRSQPTQLAVADLGL